MSTLPSPERFRAPHSRADNLLDRVGGFPQLPISSDDATTGAIIALALALALALVAALAGVILGGLAGIRFQRKVDQAGLDH
jgi:hypothetical protein